MSTGTLEDDFLETSTDSEPEPVPTQREFHFQSAVCAAGWLATNLGLGIGSLPLRLVLKEEVLLPATAISLFFIIGHLSNYIKPLAGVLTDSIPLCGTRRRHYLLFSLLATGVFWVLLSLAPRTFGAMLVVYTVMYFGVMFTSTTLGGVMVEVGNRFKASGRLTSQRIGMFKLAELTAGPIAGWLAKFPFVVPATVCGVLHLALIPFLMRFLPPETPSKLDRGPWVEVARQGRTLIRNRTLLGAAAMIILLAASPGMGTPLLFYQRDVLKFSTEFIGVLGTVGAAAGMLAAALYFPICKRFRLSTIVAVGIVAHTLGGLCYLYYNNWQTAVIVTAISAATSTMAMLPVYDIAIRATPKGSEAIGYAVMMSVWNLTNAWADWLGSLLWQGLKDSPLSASLGTPIGPLVLIDAASTVIVILAVPFMPKALSAKESDVVK